MSLVDEISEFLDARDDAFIVATGGGGSTFNELVGRIAPEVDEEDIPSLGSIPLLAFSTGLVLGMDAQALILETWIRGIEFGREIERRTR